LPRTRDALLARLPERARYVEARSMVLEDRCETWPGRDGEALLVVESSGGGLALLAGRPTPDLCERAVSDSRIETLLIEPEHEEAARQSLASWTREPARLFEMPLSKAEQMPAEEPDVRMLSAGDLDSLSHWPGELREEFLRVFPRAHVAAAFAEGRPASIAYSVETETLWDVSIDTLEAFRGRGLAARTTRWLIGHMARHGKRPIWGALESNAASRALAARLGFEETDAILVCARPES
jgi:GNAT superfamily N-acetyltransferase